VDDNVAYLEKESSFSSNIVAKGEGAKTVAICEVQKPPTWNLGDPLKAAFGIFTGMSSW